MIDGKIKTRCAHFLLMVIGLMSSDTMQMRELDLSSKTGAILVKAEYFDEKVNKGKIGHISEEYF